MNRDQYRGVVGVLSALACAAGIAAAAGGMWLSNPVLFDTAVTFVLAAGTLLGVALTQAARTRASRGGDPGDSSDIVVATGTPAVDAAVEESLPAAPSASAVDVASPSKFAAHLIKHWRDRTVHAWESLPDSGGRGNVRLATAAVAVGATLYIRLLNPVAAGQPSQLLAEVAALLLLGTVGLAAIAVRYLAGVDPYEFPEAPGLARGGRLAGWIALLGAASVGLQWVGQNAWLRPLDIGVVLVNFWFAYGLLTIAEPERATPEAFPLDLGVLTAFGSRTNILGSALDAAEAQLGIDLRSSWALTVVRHSVEPLMIGLCLLAWLSTSLTVVGVEEQGLVERLGIPRGGSPLMPGLHAHLPWPIDRVFRLPVQRVQSLMVGHEGEEENGGPEDVLWARQHAANEYTLLLGNGRDLITVDAAVHFRIRDARAWHYHSQNPADALRAIAYRAVMRTTVNSTLAEALSENLVAMTARMRAMVQQDADALDLGIEVLSFTVGGMHPPVLVAPDYQAVVSAELGKVTAVVNAQAYRNRTVPFAESAALVVANATRAEGADALAQAAGQAWSFLTLQSEYRAAPNEYMFRRRLETLESVLTGRRFTILDERFQRDGGELWLTP